MHLARTGGAKAVTANCTCLRDVLPQNLNSDVGWTHAAGKGDGHSQVYFHCPLAGRFPAPGPLRWPSFHLKREWIPGRPGILLHLVKEGQSGMRKRSVTAVNDAQLALHLQILDRHLHELSVGNLMLHGEARDQSDAVAKLDETLDRIERRELDVDTQVRFMAAKGFVDFGALGGGDVVRNEHLRAKISNGDFGNAREFVPWIDDERQSVAVHSDGAELRIFRAEGEHAELS